MGLIRLPAGGALHAAGEGPPLLFLHGVGGGAWSWRPQAVRFSAGYSTFVWEARGHGAAARVRDAGLSDYYVDAQPALDVARADGSQPVTLVAHSMGGLLAIALAATQPRNVARLFLIDPVYSDGRDAAYGHFPPALGSAARFLCFPLLRSFEHNGWMSRAVARWLFEHAFENRDRMEAAWEFQRKQIPTEYPRMLRESFVRPEGFELRDFAAGVEAPTFLLEVERPENRPRFPKLAATLRERLGARFVHERLQGGHYLQLDRPEEVSGHLARFLESSPQQSLARLR